MGIGDDETVRKRVVHEIGQDLSLLSRGELGERIAALEAEIARIRTELASKGETKSAAEALFRRP